ncbi:MAG: WbqC family protein [Bacteroidales bacterium]|nr:WbqC family protein [Bacteroidales bacterium]
MKIAIMQPYFFPYMGYFSLISLSDQFILFDTPQFIRHGWIERNRIMKENGETLFIKVPLEKHSRETPINLIKIRQENWREKILAQLVPYKKKAPFYKSTIELVKQAWDIETDSIVKLNRNSLQIICQYLDIQTPIKIWSEMNIEINHVAEPDEWALEICNALNAKTYFNPIGGKTFFNTYKYIENNIKIHFVESIPIEYKQLEQPFVPFLSIIDVLMYNSKDQIRYQINNIKYEDQ